jgi:hypothetical protein
MDVAMFDVGRPAWKVAPESLFFLLFLKQKKTRPQRTDSTTIPEMTPAITGPPDDLDAWFSSCAVSSPVPELGALV